MNITVSSAEGGRYHAHLDGRFLCTSKTPFFDAARILKAEGVLPQEPLTMTREGSDVVCLTSTIGEAARLTVEENEDRGPRFRLYRPYPSTRSEQRP